MKKRMKSYKRFISIFLAVMMIYSMAFTGVKAWASTPTLTLTASTTAWTNGAVTITANASNWSNGYYIKLQDGTTVYARTASYTVSANGTYTFKVKNSSGTTITSNSITINNIDTTAPTLTFVQNPTGTIIATASDSESGVASITKPDGTVVTGSTATYTVSANGSYNFIATDTAGNTSQQVSCTVDNIVAPTTGLTISVNDSSNQSIPQYTNSEGTENKNYQFSNPVRLAANAMAKISYNFTNVDTAKYQFVKAGDLINIPQFPQDSTMTNINLPTPNSHDSYANDIGDRGTISTMQYVYAGNPGTASSTAQLTRDVSFGTPLSSTMLVQNAIQGSDIPNYTDSTKSTAFLPDTIVYTGASQSKTSTYYVWNPFSNYYMQPSKNAAWKAMKFWGYISPPSSGWYKLGSYSDDGAYGYIIVNGQTNVFVNDWSIKQACNRTINNNPIYLTANSYYPIYMEWYEGCPTNAAFTPVYQYSSNSSTSGFSNWANVPQDYFYSSKTTTPGTIPGAYFGDVSGIPFPTDDGIYYIATKFESVNGTTQTKTSGLYGPFIIDKTPPTITNLSVKSNNQSSEKTAVAGNTLTINFTASETLHGNPQIFINGYVANANYTNISGNNYTATVNIGNDASIDSSGDKITNGPIIVEVKNYSDLSGNVGAVVQDNSVTFVSSNLGIALDLNQNSPDTNGNVVVTANATAYGNGNSIKTMKYASGSQSVNYFTAGGTNLTTNPLTSSYNSSGILQSPVQSTFNVNTNGVYTVYATDSSGNVAVQMITISNLDTTAPLAPRITEPTDGTVTMNNTPAIKGTAEANSTVKVYDGTNPNPIGTVTADENGNWILIPVTALVDGLHTITATATDAARNVSEKSNPVNITIDTVSPTLTLAQTPTTLTNGNVTINVTATDNIAIATTKWLAGTKEVSDFTSEGTVVSGNSFTVSSNGTYTVYTVDTAGNAVVRTITVSNIDTTPPDAPYITSPTNGTVTNNNKPTISGTAEANSKIIVYDTDGTTIIGRATTDNDGKWSLIPTNELAYGAHTITATATDVAGNVSDKSNQVNITIGTKPAAPVISGNPPNTTRTTDKVTITIEYSADSVAKQYRINGGAWTDYTGPFDVTENCTIEAIGTNSYGTESDTASYTVSNISVPSIISAHGLYNGNGSSVTNDSGSGFSVTDSIPVTLAMIVQANSVNPPIKLTVNNSSKIAESNIVFKKYGIDSTGNITNLQQTLTLSNSGVINLSELTMDNGGKYLITYTITPVGSGEIDLTATADNISSSSRTVKLNITTQPDLF